MTVHIKNNATLSFYMDGDRGNVTATVCSMIVVLLSWRGYSFYDENGTTTFFNDLTEGLMNTIAAGWTHPAFGACCLMPIFLFMVIVSVLFENEEKTHLQGEEE